MSISAASVGWLIASAGALYAAWWFAGWIDRGEGL